MYKIHKNISLVCHQQWLSTSKATLKKEKRISGDEQNENNNKNAKNGH